MSFEQKSCYKSLKNDFDANNRDHENEGEMSFKLIHKYLNQNSTSKIKSWNQKFDKLRKN